jgi:hypothetical protein
VRWGHIILGYGSSKQKDCIPCSPGKFSSFESSGDMQCSPCPQGTWSDRSAVNSSKYCPSCPASIGAVNSFSLDSIEIRETALIRFLLVILPRLAYKEVTMTPPALKATLDSFVQAVQMSTSDYLITVKSASRQC